MKLRPSIASLPGALALALFSLTGATTLAAESPSPPSVVLLTLDTTRADHLGSYGSESADTPNLDAIAERGTRFATAISASPLTLPAHASLLTGLRPPEHGVRDNGTARLAETIPTLATVVSDHGYETGAFVSSRVLDRRFGLARGFATYDDSMTAENLGQYGYPERDAEAVTTAAIDWLSWLSAEEPYLLWVHYYDPHLPYAPPEPWRSGTTAGDYAGEIAFVDRQIGRLLAALPDGAPPPVIAVVGDHGEALGEHGEESHGIFLYRASVEVPLLLAGPGVPAGRVVEEVVASRRLTATLLQLLGFDRQAGSLGAGLPGIDPAEPSPEPIYGESRMPASAYGWSPLASLTDQHWRFIDAPRPELYDLATDPAEERNLIDREQARAEEMSALLVELAGDAERSGEELEIDPDLAADLRALGYLSDSAAEPGEIDPKDGVTMLAEWEAAKARMRAGDARGAAVVMRQLVEMNPENIPFLSHLARAELASGRVDEGLAAYRRAVELNPRLDFLHLQLAAAYLQLGRFAEAKAELELTLELNPRSADAWLSLAELALRSGDAAEERRLLSQAIEAGTSSAAIRVRLGQIEMGGGDPAAAETHLRRATDLAPEWPLAWQLRADNAERRGRWDEAVTSYRRAAEVGGRDLGTLLRLGRLELRHGDPEAGRRALEEVVTASPGSVEAAEARRLLAEEPSRSAADG